MDTPGPKIQDHLRRADAFGDAFLDAREKFRADPENPNHVSDSVISEVFAEEELVEAAILALEFLLAEKP